MNDEFVHAYFAGFFDGEGCVHVGFKRKGGHLVCFLSLNQNTRHVLDLAVSIWGGSIGLKKKSHVYYWQLCGRKSEAFARGILPFTLVKTSQLEKYLELRSGIRYGKPLTDAERFRRFQLVSSIKGDRGYE